MKKLLLGSVALVALGMGAPAIAADMRARPLPPPAPVFTWTGCYVGGYVGYLSGHSRHRSAEATPTTPIALTGVGGITATLFPGEGPIASPGSDITPRFNESGMIGGGTAGCNWQAGVWVVGVEIDGGPSNKDGQAFDIFPFNTTFVSQTSERWLATARLRLGWAVDKWLFYVTGGGAWAGVEATVWNSQVLSPTTFLPVAGGTYPSAHHKRTLGGYAVGLGVEYALGYGWSIKSEYLYINFGWSTFFDPPDSVWPSVTNFVNPRDVYLDNHVFKWGLNYKFDFGKGVAVMAKY